MDKGTQYRANNAYFSPAVGSAIHEITPSVTWHKKGHNMKIVADAPVYLNMPLYYERGLGAYVFAEQPGQVSLLSTAGNSTRRRAVYEGRVMFQFAF